MFQEFPKHLHKAGGAFLVVNGHAEQAEALEQGWQLEPVLDAPELELIAEVAPEAVSAPAIEAPKPRRGRKPKIAVDLVE